LRVSNDSLAKVSIFVNQLTSRLHFELYRKLFYYEDCTIKEIAGILKTSESNVKVRLTRGRKLLKQDLQEEWNDDDE